MEIIDHGIFYNDSVDIFCNKCGCRYRIHKEDIKKYDKPIKVHLCAYDDCWTEKRYYYTLCPECENSNPLEPRDYEILTTEIKEVKR